MREFKKGYYECYSSVQHDALIESGFGESEEFSTIWRADQRIKWLESHGKDYDPSKIQDLERNGWRYEGTPELSEFLTDWSNNRPI